jgi:hypothetical protein
MFEVQICKGLPEENHSSVVTEGFTKQRSMKTAFAERAGTWWRGGLVQGAAIVASGPAKGIGIQKRGRRRSDFRKKQR